MDVLGSLRCEKTSMRARDSLGIWKAAVPKHTQNQQKNPRNLKHVAFIEFLEVSGQNTYILQNILSELTQTYSRYQPKCKNSV